VGARIIVIDDGSSDGTAALLDQISGIQVYHSPVNRGYGASIKKGISLTRTPVLVWFDADGQHLSSDFHSLVKPVLQGRLDAHLGARRAADAFILKRAPGKWLLRMVSQIIARRKIPDLNCGFRCFKTSVISRYLHLLPNGFSASSTSTLIMIKRNYNVEFLKVGTQHRIGKSTVKIFRDGFNTLLLIFNIVLLFDSLLFFSVCAFLQLLIGISYSLVMAMRTGLGIPLLGGLFIISGILTFFMGILASEISQIRKERFEIDEK
jgi:glycosyltransferase involved in cell wall biosynthesis